MGKKSKVGKSRKDKFYHLAKETGFRARSAFKLLQLNRKYEFLQQSRVCIDLCAAPGGWLQVAAQNMPVSSHILGVDLVPIKPIRNCLTFQADITSEKCRQILKKELQTWKADVILNDGAPNVGQNWIQDAFAQAELTLSAMKLATEFLRKGGWFVTKVFRSKDYHALMWVFNQLFKKVFATKPQASRNESAEIFVVCQGFLAPDKLDPKFTDAKYVFKEVASDPKSSLNLLHPTKVNKKAEGYADGDYTLHHKVNVTEFLSADNHTELLADCHEIVIDDEEVAKHPLTTKEIRECLTDIKVLGKKDLRNIISWRKKIKADLGKKKGNDEEESMEENVDESEDEEQAMNKKISEIQDEEMQALKKKKKKVMKDKRKLRDKMALNMVIPGDTLAEDDMELFNIKKMKKKHQLEGMNEAEMAVAESDESGSDEEMQGNRMAYDRDSKAHFDETISDEEIHEESDDEESDDEEDDDEENTPSNPLVVDLESKATIQSRKAQMWFSKGAFSGLDMNADEDVEISKMIEDYKSKGGQIKGASSTKKRKLKQVDAMEAEPDSGHGSDDELSDSDLEEDEVDSDSDYDDHAALSVQPEGERKRKAQANKDGFEIVPSEPAKKVVKLDPVGLAMGEELIKSRKRRRELVEDSFNRYTFNDDDLPDWFVKDEARHCTRQLPVTKEQINAYKEKMKAIDARAPKKVIEAKARKKRKSMKKLEKARKKAEVITDNQETSEKEKWSQIKQVYKKAGLLSKKKRELTYVVAKKGAGKKVSRPAGVKGQFKVVDPRMKKDMRKEKANAKKGSGKGSKGKKSKRR